MKRDPPPSRAWVERRYPPRWAESLLEARAAHSDPVWSYRSVYNPADSRFQRHPSISALHLFLWCHRNPVSPLPSQFKNIQFSKSAALSVNRSCIIKGEAESCVARKGCEHRGPVGSPEGAGGLQSGERPLGGVRTDASGAPGELQGPGLLRDLCLQQATPVSQIRKGAPRGVHVSHSRKASAAGPHVSSFTWSIRTRRKTEPRLIHDPV